MFSGPALLSLQSQLPNLAVTPMDQHIPYLNQLNQRDRRHLESIRQEALEAHLERQKSLQERKNKDGSPRKEPSPRKSTIRAQIDFLPQRTNEEQKLRKVVQYELDHYNLSNPSSPRKRQKPPVPLTPPATPPNLSNVSLSSQTSTGTTRTPSTTGLKSILKVSSVPEDIPSTSPLKEITIEKTASAKLNYLMEQIVKYHKDEKIIVFSDQGTVMWYLGEALELLGIQHLIYIQKLVYPFIFRVLLTRLDARSTFPVHCHIQFLSTLPRPDHGNPHCRPRSERHIRFESLFSFDSMATQR